MMDYRKEARLLTEERIARISGGERHEILTEGLDTMGRHEFMYAYAEQNELKGARGGDCNVTQCQKPGATWFNSGTNAWYCESCAKDINWSCRHSDFYPLCKDEQTFDEEQQWDGIIESLTVKDKGVEKTTHFQRGFVDTYKRESPKIGRNEPCPCGSGSKFKKCCGA